MADQRESSPNGSGVYEQSVVVTTRKLLLYAVVDAFAAQPFEGNPAAVCLDETDVPMDGQVMQSLAAEFNLSETAFLVRDSSHASGATPRFQLQWFTPVNEVELSGHATLACAHFLFTKRLKDHEDMVEFMTLSGILTAKKIPAPESIAIRKGHQGGMFIELDFPMIDFVDYKSSDEMISIAETLNGASIVSVHMSAKGGHLIVELSSGKEVVDLHPNIDEIRKCAGRGVIFTAPAPAGSGYDIFSRFFCPKFGVNEDPVTGSIHCVLAPFWHGKLGKENLKAFQASQRGGTLWLELDSENRRVRIQGQSVTVMDGTVVAKFV